jgi:hypothetical protein
MIGRRAYRYSGYNANDFRLRPYVAVLHPGSTTPTSSGVGGLITATFAFSRQEQFGLKPLWQERKTRQIRPV